MSVAQFFGSLMMMKPSKFFFCRFNVQSQIKAFSNLLIFVSASGTNTKLNGIYEIRFLEIGSDNIDGFDQPFGIEWGFEVAYGTENIAINNSLVRVQTRFPQLVQ